ncbi:MAG TPA: YdeI/OmpD-associated family protein [Candidatus Saccharimonadales bacterium]|nr:YdeI/OmpD-associated family protein [Candidatus Saccharimonadales bacterium]
MKTKSQHTDAPTISFKARLYVIGKWTILRLPEGASEKLPSRGQVMVRGTINGHDLQQVLEPDGRWGHWLKVDKKMQKAISADAGDTVSLEIAPSKDWPEPKLPADFSKALATALPIVQDLWAKITPMARWEWLRWVNATSSTETRQRRIEVSISKLRSGKRRPCCFNLAACTDPDLAKNSRLIEPTNTTTQSI